MLILLVGATCIAVTTASPLTVNTNKPSYNPGEIVSVTGVATASADVTIQFYNPTGSMILMDYFTAAANGSYSKTFVIPSTIPTGSWSYGTYTVRAFSGSESVNATFTLAAPSDTTAPTISSVTPAADSTVTTARPTITVTYSDNVAINTGTAKFTVDGADVTTVATVTAASTSYTPTADLSQGSHTLYFEIKDTAGNTANRTWSFTIVVDTTAPVITGLAPANGSISSSGSVTIGASYSDNVAIDVSSVALRVDGSVVAPTSVTATAVSYSATLAEGTHTISLTVEDTSHNQVASSWTFVVDTTAPVISTPSPANGTTVTSTSVTVSASYSDNTAIDTSQVVLKIDGNTVTATASATGVSYSTTLEEGTHTAQLTVKDTAGNTSTTTWTFTVKVPVDYTLYYIIGAGVVIIVIVAAFFLMKRK